MMTEQTSDRANSRCGFVAIVGAPNVGKSTLINQIVGAKVSIVSPKVQTTRSRFRGLAVHDQSQLVFVDTPGIFSPRRQLDRSMVSAAWQGANDADIITLLVDSVKGIDEETAHIIKTLQEREKRAVAVLNKIDLVDKSKLLEFARQLEGTKIMSEIFMISAVKGDGVEKLVEYLAQTVPKGPWLYPDDEIADTPLMLWAAEITREQLYLQLHQELPYAATVDTESYLEKEDGSLAFNQVIYVERQGHKGIVLGKGGSRIKSIGEAARRELEKLFDRRVHLMLFVKVSKNWAEDPDHYRNRDLDPKA
ncbi:MAG: GTPase Era [Rhodospirillaceae bacterium]|jgi:GTP-binding protein Era